MTSRSFSKRTLFFTLQDEESRLNCIFFDYNGPDLSSGGKFLVTGTPVYSKKFGELRFHVKSITAAGPGEMRERFRLLVERLEKEGLFSAAIKIPVPANCSDVCVITSKTGAVVHDIIVTARKRNPAVNIRVFPVRVQGIGADLEIVEALKILDKSFVCADVLIVARGGGSAEELEVFNSEALARAVAACKKPVVSAVGHETDYTLCDLAADLRVPTPTAAAAAVTADISGAVNTLALQARLLKRSAIGAFNAKMSVLNSYYGRLSASAEGLLNARAYETARLGRAVQRSLENLFRDRLNQLDALKISLKSNDPLSVLERGYAKLYKEKPVASVSQVETGDVLDVVLADGTLRTVVSSKKKIERTGCLGTRQY